jgi:putative transposase
MCRMLQLHPSGYYAWKANPESKRAADDRRLLGLLKQAWLESGGVYGYRKLTLDMRDLGESCSKHGRRPRSRGGAAAIVAPNLLQQQFKVSEPNMVWVTDITYVSTHEGWLYLAAVIDLYSRQVVGWSTGSRIDTQLVLDALHMAVWRRRPSGMVVVHSDQGCQFTSHEWQRFLSSHNLEPSMSRRGNCHDNAVAESFFQLLKRERIRRKTYATRQEARSDVFSYIEMFYNPIRRHSSADGLSPIEFERRNSVRLEAF